ncbi:MAG: hypothetical protein BroJett011_54860 [Chloroflexota bacterium]|nr:MAG: hypothetical protein BroJett011_54860 [Chloroflexota bacterium]
MIRLKVYLTYFITQGGNNENSKVFKWVGLGKTVIVATRQPELIEDVGDEVAILSQGRLLTQQPLAHLLRAPQATIFEIKFKGHLATHWRDWFDNLSMTHTEAGETILAGPIKDQAALYGTVCVKKA